ncbi:hypothetical protein CBM2614_A120168 [Cupriavidus taiwanensis]|uniref:Uncharacterized protein n=1 Tax=Cupriavidus taiwanensis TaxID=164546 RepID=A0A976ATB0_9BURK|nr:hypothetical protein CBM2614_A120168 [Cupriavidus taiwanensis]SOZ52015.1 hypothetical protein CBM2613_A110170 [Cupriavidus taiwanensis]
MRHRPAVAMLRCAMPNPAPNRMESCRSIGGFNWLGPGALPRLVFQASKTHDSEVTHAAIREDPV